MIVPPVGWFNCGAMTTQPVPPPSAAVAQPEPVYASVGNGNYAIVVGSFVGLLLISNICATKLISFGAIVTDGGAILFPLTYIIGDILSEVYGLKAAKRAIYLGFGFSALAAATFWLVQLAPPADGYENQAAFEAVLGFVPRIVVASLLAFMAGQLLNAYVLVKIKDRTRERYLWIRLIGSTLVGEFADTLVFCTIAFFGVIGGWEFFSYVLTGYLYKCLIEVLFLPVTYRVIAVVKRHEPTYVLVEPVAAVS